MWVQAQVLADHSGSGNTSQVYKRGRSGNDPTEIPRLENDLVVLVDDCLAGGQWRMGQFVKTVPGRDGLVRTVTVKTGESITLVRPIQKLCLLKESGNLSCLRDNKSRTVNFYIFDIILCFHKASPKFQLGNYRFF